MRVTFDLAKSERNRTERGLGFEMVAAFDFDTALIWIDSRFDYGEARYVALGLIDGRVHVTVFTETATGVRHQSAQANQREVKRYELHR